VRDVADALGVSERHVHHLRREPWFPLAIELGPRTLRYDINEVLEAIRLHGRRTEPKSEPAALAAARSRPAR
jgi:predicted DNA-binding transcriptional regulator AlpA